MPKREFAEDFGEHHPHRPFVIDNKHCLIGSPALGFYRKEFDGFGDQGDDPRQLKSDLHAQTDVTSDDLAQKHPTWGKDKLAPMLWVARVGRIL